MDGKKDGRRYWVYLLVVDSGGSEKVEVWEERSISGGQATTG